MCFSNLPVEFDEAGDPYLAHDAEDVSRPGAADGEHEHEDHDHSHTTARDCGCGGPDDVALDEAPEAAFEEIVASVTDATRTHLAGAGGAAATDGADPAADRDQAGGD